MIYHRIKRTMYVIQFTYNHIGEENTSVTMPFDTLKQAKQHIKELLTKDKDVMIFKGTFTKVKEKK